MGDNNESDMNTKLLEKKINNHVYNEKKGKYPFLLEFKQLKHYYNQRKEFKNDLSLGYFSPDNEENESNPSNNSQKKEDVQFKPQKKISQNMFCLIDRKWLIKWKKHIGYKEIKNKIKEVKINNNDYNWISEIIDKNYKENYLNPLDNNVIYKDNEIDPSTDFKVIHKDSFKLFSIISENSDKNQNYRKYPIRLLKDKYIIFLNNDMFYILYKNINSQKYSEIIVYFLEMKEKNEEANKSQNEKMKGSKKKIMDIFTNNDLNEWLKEINFNYLNEIEKEIEYNNCKIRIYNKTLLRKVEESQMRNSIFPDIECGRNELLNANTLSNGLTKIVEAQLKANQFMMRSNKTIDSNISNNPFTGMVFENIKQNKLKSSKINLNNDEKEINNDMKIENNDNHNLDKFNDKTYNILNIDNNIDDRPFKSIKYNSQENQKQLTNNSDFINNNQVNNFVNSQSQPNFSQNQNNNFNYNNNQNNNINNCNFQNQMQLNNNNIIQNNNSQGLCTNNNMMNIDFNSLQNNQIFDFNNCQSNMYQQNNLLLNCNQNMQFNSCFPNIQNNNLMQNNFQPNFNNFNDYQKIMMNMYLNFMNNLNFLNNNNVQNNNNNGKKYPHKSGLQNIGQTCYMNATVECLSNIQEITDYLLNLNDNFISQEKSLTLSYRSLLMELFLNGQKCVVPEVFKTVIGELNPLFQGNHAADSKDLVFFIIERLHLELNNENKNFQIYKKIFFNLK